MSPAPYRSVRSLLLASLAFSGVSATGALAVVHLETSPAAPTTSAGADADAVLDRASSLMTQEKVIRARAMLLALQNSPTGAALGDEQGQRLWSMLAKIERQIQRVDRLEISLQKAEFAYSTDNLVEAQRQADTVINSGKSTREQISSAQAIRDLIEVRRNEAAPKIDPTLRVITKNFNSGDYGAAKLLVTRIGQLGLPLTGAQADTLAMYRDKLTKLEQTRGVSLGTFDPAMGMLAPENAMNSDWLTGSTQDGARSGAYLANQETTGGAGQPEDQPAAAAEQHPDVTSVQPAEGVEIVGEQPPIDLLESARRFEAQSLMGQANMAYEENRFNQAMTLYDQVISSYSQYVSPEDLKLARDRRAQAQVQLGVQGGPDQDILEDTTRLNSLELQRAQAAFKNYMEQSKAALAQGDATTARNLAAQATLTIKQARNVMPESAYEGYQDTIADLITQINTTEEQQRIAQAEAERQRLAQQTRQLAEERNRERDEKINANLERVHALQQELKYEEALEVVDSILFLDPTNPAGLLLRDIIQDTLIYRENLGYQREKSLSYARESLDAQEAMIAPNSLIGYPDDWPAISFRRGDVLEFAESDANRRVLSTMRETRMPIEFNDNAFEDVIAFIGSTTGIDIDVDWASLADIGVDPDSPVALTLKNVQIDVLLDRVLAKVSDPTLPAGWAIQDGILTIASDEVLRLNTVLETYDIRDLIFVVPDFDNAPEFDLQSAVQAASGGGGGGGQSPFSGGSQDVQNLPTRDDRVTAIVDLIQANVDPDGWTAIGGDTSSITELNGNFIITTTPKNHRAIIGLLNKLREQRAVQINVETRFLSVDQNFFEQIGFDLDVYFNAKGNEFEALREFDPSLLPSNFFDSEGNFLPNVSGGGNIGVDTDGDGIADTFEPIVQPNLGPGHNSNWSIIRAAQDSFGLTNSLASASSFASQIIGLNPALGVTGRFLDDVQVDFLVEATQADQRSVVLTAPRLTFTNGQRSYIAVSTTTTFISDLTPVVGSSAGAFDPTISTIPTGVVIDVQGVASADRRYVTLTVQTTQSRLSFGNERQVSGAAGGGGTVGGNAANFVGTVQIPIVDATELRTTVTIPDQGTVLLGGQRVVEEIQVETGVPVLSKIPILSRFFSNRVDSKTDKTLLVLLKPTILIQNEEEELNFPGLLDQLGR